MRRLSQICRYYLGWYFLCGFGCNLGVIGNKGTLHTDSMKTISEYI